MSIIINDENLTGYIIIDGNGCLFGIVKGNEKTVLHSFTAEIPIRKRQHLEAYGSKRIRKIELYLQKVSDIATLLFLPTHKIIIAGAADLKHNLKPMLDNLSVIKVIDVSYGMHPGFCQAIELSEYFSIIPSTFFESQYFKIYYFIMYIAIVK